jgi:hypothetical protein
VRRDPTGLSDTPCPAAAPSCGASSPDRVLRHTMTAAGPGAYLFQFVHRRFCVATAIVLAHPAVRQGGLRPLAARTTLATAPRAPARPGRASRKNLDALGTTPHAPSVGLCGCLAAGQPYQKATGGTAQLGKPPLRQNLLGGPPLGAFRRCVWGDFRPSPSCRRRPGESRRGKRMCSAASLAHAGLPPRARLASRGPQPSN